MRRPVHLDKFRKISDSIIVTSYHFPRLIRGGVCVCSVTDRKQKEREAERIFTMSVSCYDSLFTANIDMIAGVTAIVLCANTVFEVGAPVDSNFNSFAGGFPLIVETDSVTIQCGDTGVSTDSCVLEGGFAQLFLGDPSDTTSTANNLSVKGVTFKGTMESIDNAVDGSLAPRAVYATNSGSNIVFEDCVFEDMVTGYVFDITPSGTMDVTIQTSDFRNIEHSFDVIYGDSSATVSLVTVSFDNIQHVEPADGIDKCEGFTAATCDYTSSVIKLAGASSTLSGVTISDSTYYTAILQTSFLMDTPDPLITATNTVVYLEANRTINEEYCLGGYAYNYDTSTGFDWSCTRLTSSVDVFELLKCGKDCNELDSYSTFVAGLELTGLNDTLAALGDVTIFVPTNEAMENAPDGFLERLFLNDTETLKTILEYHITAEDPILTEAIDLGVPAAVTLMGESVSFTPPTTSNNLYMVDDAEIIIQDWEESPGAGKVIQVINGVLIPESVQVFPSLGERIEELQLTSLIAAGDSIDWDPGLDIDKDYSK
jgi:uncharacterized surface protein with fasciclin (FAS1) repeats